MKWCIYIRIILRLQFWISQFRASSFSVSCRWWAKKVPSPALRCCERTSSACSILFDSIHCHLWLKVVPFSLEINTDIWYLKIFKGVKTIKRSNSLTKKNTHSEMNVGCGTLAKQEDFLNVCRLYTLDKKNSSTAIESFPWREKISYFTTFSSEVGWGPHCSSIHIYIYACFLSFGLLSDVGTSTNHAWCCPTQFHTVSWGCSLKIVKLVLSSLGQILVANVLLRHITRVHPLPTQNHRNFMEENIATCINY